MRPLFVGEAPSKRPSIGRNSSRGRLANLVGVKPLELRWTNLFEHLVEEFDQEEARAAAARINGRESRLILLGQKVAKAFGLERPIALRWMLHRGSWVAVIPHPSGLNRWWNEAENRDAVEKFLRPLFMT